ncbi:MAG: hypothetical protein ACXVI2_15335 [Ilumatobacteraceae bacterium]
MSSRGADGPSRGGDRMTRRQVGETLLFAGLSALVGTPIVYRIRASSAHVRMSRVWWWPTWWMLVPLLAAGIGVMLMLAPPAVDVRRRFFRRRSDSRARRP